MLSAFSTEHIAPPYKEYKAQKFEKNKRKILNILNGISQTSLKEKDKEILLADIKTIVANFNDKTNSKCKN